MDVAGDHLLAAAALAVDQHRCVPAGGLSRQLFTCSIAGENARNGKQRQDRPRRPRRPGARLEPPRCPHQAGRRPFAGPRHRAAGAGAEPEPRSGRDAGQRSLRPRLVRREPDDLKRPRPGPFGEPRPPAGSSARRPATEGVADGLAQLPQRALGGPREVKEDGPGPGPGLHPWSPDGPTLSPSRPASRVMTCEPMSSGSRPTRVPPSAPAPVALRRKDLKAV